MTKEEQDAHVATIVKALEQTKKLLDQSNTRGKTRLPYYTSHHAEWAKEVIEQIVSSGVPHVLPIGDFTLNTQTVRWHQSTKYLTDHLDDDGEWKKKLDLIVASQSKKRGLLLSPRPESGCLKAYAIKPWRPDFEKFIEDAEEGDIKEWIGIPFTPEDVKYVYEAMLPYTDLFLWSMEPVYNPKALKIVRMTKEQAEMVLQQEHEKQDTRDTGNHS